VGGAYGKSYPLADASGIRPTPLGHTGLSPIYPNHKFDEKIGEAAQWDVQSRERTADRQDFVAAERHIGANWWGCGARSETIPLLVKFLFPHESCQCRCILMNEQAHAWANLGVKPSCCNIAHAKPWSADWLGLKAGVTVNNWKKRLHESGRKTYSTGSNVYSGDMIYSRRPVHTLGPDRLW